MAPYEPELHLSIEQPRRSNGRCSPLAISLAAVLLQVSLRMCDAKNPLAELFARLLRLREKLWHMHIRDVVVLGRCNVLLLD